MDGDIQSVWSLLFFKLLQERLVEPGFGFFPGPDGIVQASEAAQIMAFSLEADGARHVSGAAAPRRVWRSRSFLCGRCAGGRF